MDQCCGDCETREREGSDGRGGDTGIRIGDVVEHCKPEEWVAETKDSAREERRDPGDGAVGGECEPEEGDGEEPDCHEGGQESGFRSRSTASFCRI